MHTNVVLKTDHERPLPLNPRKFVVSVVIYSKSQQLPWWVSVSVTLFRYLDVTVPLGKVRSVKYF